MQRKKSSKLATKKIKNKSKKKKEKQLKPLNLDKNK